MITPSSWTCSILLTWSLLVWYVSAEGPTSTYIMYHPLHGCTYSCVEESEHSQYSQNATHVADRKSTRLLWRCTFCLDWIHTPINCRVSWHTNMPLKTVLAATRCCERSSGLESISQLLPLSKPWRGLRSCNSSAGYRLTLSFDSSSLFWLILRRGYFKKQPVAQKAKKIVLLKHTTADEQSCFVPPSL